MVLDGRGVRLNKVTATASEVGRTTISCLNVDDLVVNRPAIDEKDVPKLSAVLSTAFNT